MGCIGIIDGVRIFVRVVVEVAICLVEQELEDRVGMRNRSAGAHLHRKHH